MSYREHCLENGADCWCEPRIIPVLCDDGETNYVFSHHTERCAQNIGGCICNQKYSEETKN